MPRPAERGPDAGRTDRDRGDSLHSGLGRGAGDDVQVKREQERELRRDLWEMRDAIDHYKDAADKHAFQTKVDSQNYPPDLETLVNGVEVQGKKVKFLRRIPVDPMTGKAEWGLRSMQDDPQSDSFGGQSVFDVYSKSQGRPWTERSIPRGSTQSKSAKLVWLAEFALSADLELSAKLAKFVVDKIEMQR